MTGAPDFTAVLPGINFGYSTSRPGASASMLCTTPKPNMSCRINYSCACASRLGFM